MQVFVRIEHTHSYRRRLCPNDGVSSSVLSAGASVPNFPLTIIGSFKNNRPQLLDNVSHYFRSCGQGLSKSVSADNCFIRILIFKVLADVINNCRKCCDCHPTSGSCPSAGGCPSFLVQR